MAEGCLIDDSGDSVLKTSVLLSAIEYIRKMAKENHINPVSYVELSFVIIHMEV